MLADAQFWRERKKAFRESDKEEYRSLRGHWDSISDNYGLPGSEEGRHRFEILAEAAARGLPNPQRIELWKLWLAELIRKKINYREGQHTRQCPQEYLENPEHPLRVPGELPLVEGRQNTGTTIMVFEGKIVTIDRPLEASAILCELLESMAELPFPNPAEPVPATVHRGEQMHAAEGVAGVIEVTPNSRVEHLQAAVVSLADGENCASHTETDHAPRNDEKGPGRYVHRYHATQQPKYVTEAEAAELGPDWSETYIHQDYPKWKYHRTKAGVIVKDAQEEAALGPGWANSPGVFSEETAIITTERSDPIRWVDDWQVSDLSVGQRTKIKAQLLKAEAEFSRSSQEHLDRHVAPMQQAFNGTAEVLFEARILTAELLRNEIRALVWDSAIAGSWWRPASDERTDGYPEQLGHYWVWAGHGKEWAGLFRAETSEWLGRLLEASARTESNPPRPSRKTPARLLTEYKVVKKIRTHELVAENLGLERSVYFDLKAGRKVGEETYIKAALLLGCSPDDLKP